MGSTLTALATSLGKTAVRLALEGTEQNGDEIANEVLLNLIKPKTLLNLKKVQIDEETVQELLCCFLGSKEQCDNLTDLFNITYPYTAASYERYKDLSK